MLSLIIPKTFNFNVANVKCHIKILKSGLKCKKNDVKKNNYWLLVNNEHATFE